MELLERVVALSGIPRDAVPLTDLEASVSGVCLFARNPGATQELAASHDRMAERFLGLAKGVVNKRGKIERPLTKGAVRVRTRYERLSVERGHSLLKRSSRGPCSGGREPSDASHTSCESTWR